MKKLVLCALAGALVAHIWGIVSWTALPWHFSHFKEFGNDRVVADALTTEVGEAGIYLVPNFGPEVHKEGPAMELFHTLMEEGPYAYMVVLPDGIVPNMPIMMLKGFLLNLLFAFTLYWLLSQTKITEDKNKILFIAVAGTLGALHPLLSYSNWWFFPIGTALIGIADYTIMWTLAGVTMVKLNNKLS